MPERSPRHLPRQMFGAAPAAAQPGLLLDAIVIAPTLAKVNSFRTILIPPSAVPKMPDVNSGTPL